MRQHSSRYVATAKRGQRVAVTERGKLVAYLVPVDEPRTTLQRMIAAGQATLATGDLRDHLDDLVPAERGEELLSETLRTMRDEER